MGKKIGCSHLSHISHHTKFYQNRMKHTENESWLFLVGWAYSS